MVIDFENMEEKAVDGFKGGVGITHLRKFENDLGKIIMGRLEPGASIGLHTHETNSEIIYIISGTADFIYDPDTKEGQASSGMATAVEFDQSAANTDIKASPNCDASKTAYNISETVSAGGCHYCPKGHTHSMINNGDEDIVFFATIPEQ